jgi:hypothetical protein
VKAVACALSEHDVECDGELDYSKSTGHVHFAVQQSGHCYESDFLILFDPLSNHILSNLWWVLVYTFIIYVATSRSTHVHSQVTRRSI